MCLFTIEDATCLMAMKDDNDSLRLDVRRAMISEMLVNSHRRSVYLLTRKPSCQGDQLAGEIPLKNHL